VSLNLTIVPLYWTTPACRLLQPIRGSGKQIRIYDGLKSHQEAVASFLHSRGRSRDLKACSTGLGSVTPTVPATDILCAERLGEVY